MRASGSTTAFGKARPRSSSRPTKEARAPWTISWRSARATFIDRLRSGEGQKAVTSHPQKGQVGAARRYPSIIDRRGGECGKAADRGNIDLAINPV
jgi:hypothetical protein